MPTTKWLVSKQPGTTPIVPSRSMDEGTTTISPASSFHASDYTSDDNSLGGREEELRDEPLSRGRLLRPISNSSSSSSGGSPWADGTASSSSVSYEADFVLSDKRAVFDGSVRTGADSTHPIDVTTCTVRTIVASAQAAPVGRRTPSRPDARPHLSPKRQGLRDEERIDRIVSLSSVRQSSHRPEPVRPHPQDLHKIQSSSCGTGTPRMSNCNTIGRCVPAVVRPEAVIPEDDISTIGGQFHTTYSPAVFLHNMIQQCGSKQWDVERGRATKTNSATGEGVRHISPSCCMYRSDFELFLIVIIAASLLTLVVLLALILATR